MNSVQESKQELEAAIRYAENAISSANKTIESMATYQEQTGREAALEEERAMLEKNVKYLRDENERLKREKEASSGPCGCQAYRDLEEKVATMPVIPKAVAIAIFREGMQSGINDAVAELEGQSINISENDYVGDFSVSFERDIDLDDHLDLDWMRGKVGNYSEEFITGALKNLCADKEFECRIHGVDDVEAKDSASS
jgi:hypothetical protein